MKLRERKYLTKRYHKKGNITSSLMKPLCSVYYRSSCNGLIKPIPKKEFDFFRYGAFSLLPNKNIWKDNPSNKISDSILSSKMIKSIEDSFKNLPIL